MKPELSRLLCENEMEQFLIVDDEPGTSKSSTKKSRTVKEVCYILLFQVACIGSVRFLNR